MINKQIVTKKVLSMSKQTVIAITGRQRRLLVSLEESSATSAAAFVLLLHLQHPPYPGQSLPPVREFVLLHHDLAIGEPNITVNKKRMRESVATFPHLDFVFPNSSQICFVSLVGAIEPKILLMKSHHPNLLPLLLQLLLLQLLL